MDQTGELQMTPVSRFGWCAAAGALLITAGAAQAQSASETQASSVIVPVVPGDAPVVVAEAIKEMPVIGMTGERLGTLKEVALDLGHRNIRYGLVMPARTGVGLKPVPFEAFVLAYDPETIRAGVEAQAAGGEAEKLRVDADDLVGRDVLNEAGIEISEVDDIVLTEGGAGPLVVMDVGGFLGIGDKQIALPVSDFALIDDQLVLETGLSEEDMEAAPAFDPQEGEPIDRAESITDLRRLERSEQASAAGDRQERLDLDDKVLALRITAAEFDAAPLLDGGENIWPASPAFDQQIVKYYSDLIQPRSGDQSEAGGQTND